VARIACVLCLALVGCASAASNVDGGLSNIGEPTGAPGRYGPGGASRGRSARARPATLPVKDHLEQHDSRSIPGGLACLIRLRELEIPHRHLARLRGVDTPVQILGPIGGIHFRPLGRIPLVADCRLVLALRRAAPYLRNLGVTELRFSSAYSYRMMPSGRLSRHAMGLAIDVHEVVADGGEVLRVSEDYEVGFEGGGCALNAALLNRMGCLLAELGLFDRVLTPDFDKAHYNHFHLAILSLHRRRHSPLPRPETD